MGCLAAAIIISSGSQSFKAGSTSHLEVPDYIFYNGSVVTMNDGQPEAEALAVQGEIILAVGSDEEILYLQGDETLLIDLRGKTVLPGIVDAHTHIFNDAGMYLDMSLDEAQELALQNGITCLADMYVTEEFLDEMQYFEQAGRLRIRTSLYMNYNTNCGDILGDWYLNHPPTRVPGEMLRSGGVKMFADGGSCGLPAFTFEYPEGGYGDLWLSQEELNQAVTNAHAAGYQVVVHAYGDSAVKTAQNAFESVLEGQPNMLRHRIEHNTVVRPDLLSRYTEIDIVPVLFGYFPTCDEVEYGVWQYYVGEERLSWVRPNRALLDANPGLTFAWHGDDPWVGPINPFLELYSLVTRKEVDEDGETICEPPDWSIDGAITVDEALHMMTTGAAFALFREDEVGSVEADKYADLIVVSDNPLAVDPDSIKDIGVLLTMVGGSVEYCAPGQPDLCGRIEENLSLNKPSSASSSLPSNPPELAVDGDLETHWGAGNYPPQWFEVDLQAAGTIDNVKLVVDQNPHGNTRHSIWGKGPEPGADYQLLHEFDRSTRSGDVLSYSPPAPWGDIQYVKIETESGPSWVSWLEIEIIRRATPPVSTGGSDRGSGVPRASVLRQNYPNPFNPSTTIAFEITGTSGERQLVDLFVYDIRGRLVKTLIHSKFGPGSHRINWDGLNDQGDLVSSGLYLYTLRIGNRALTRKMMVLK